MLGWRSVVAIAAVIACVVATDGLCQNSNDPTSEPSRNANAQQTYTNSNQNSSTSAYSSITRAQAEAMIGPALPIVDIHNPAMVFNSPDELIRAAVADWLSQIKQPHDQYGNLITDCYKGSYCPDRLDSKLIEHIINFTKGRRLIALSAGHALSLANTQLTQRNYQIEQIIRNGSKTNTNQSDGGNGNTSRTSNNNNGNGNSPEDVPSLNNNNGTTPSTNNNNSTSSNNNNSTANNNNATSANNNNSTTGGTLEEQLESKYGIIIANSDDSANGLKKWQDYELQWLDEALSKIPTSWVRGHKFMRGVQPSDRPTVYGQTVDTGDTSGELTIFDYCQDSTGAATDFPVPPYSAESSKKLEFMATVIHESTHLYQFYGGQQKHSNLSDQPFVQSWASTFGWTYDNTDEQTLQQMWAIDSTRVNERPTEYAIPYKKYTDCIIPNGPVEDMAESMWVYCLDPERLKKTENASSAQGKTGRYDFIKNTLGISEASSATLISGSGQVNPPGISQ